MVQARIKHGRVEVDDVIPTAWEGWTVQLVPLAPEKSPDNLDELLAEIHSLGPMELDADERQAIAQALGEMDQVSAAALRQLPSFSQ